MLNVRERCKVATRTRRVAMTEIRDYKNSSHADAAYVRRSAHIERRSNMTAKS
jgi:hypothetical protein